MAAGGIGLQQLPRPPLSQLRFMFFYQARKEIEDADILIVNHHLYFSDLALRDDHASILPAHDVVVFDEAHSLEDVATNHMGLSITDAQVRWFLDSLWSNKGKGILADQPWGSARQQVETTRQAAEKFWRAVASYGIQAGDDPVQRIHVANAIENSLSGQFNELAKQLRMISEQSEDLDSGNEIKAKADRCDEFSGTIRNIISQQLEQYIYYSTVPHGDRGAISLTANPLSVAELLRNHLWGIPPAPSSSPRPPSPPMTPTVSYFCVNALAWTKHCANAWTVHLITSNRHDCC